MSRSHYEAAGMIFDDLGWSLMEVKTENNKNRLCAFSSVEICLGDYDEKRQLSNN